jgi:hypothetical protein
MRGVVALVLAALVVPILHAGSRQGAASLPGRLDEYVTKVVKLPAAERSQLLAGHPVTQIMEADRSSEVAVFGAVWVNAPIPRYVAAVSDIEQFEKGENFRVTKKISSPPRIEDFAALKLPTEDLADLRTCRLGSCELKLSEGTIKRLRSEIDWSKPTATIDVEQLARRLMLDYVNGYLEGGNARLATYRDSGRPTFVAKEFASMIDRMPSLVVYLPDLRRYLLDYPKTTLPKSTSFLYWQEAKFGLKPTIRLNHLTVAEEATHTAVVSKMLYASHYFWTALELRVLVPDPARGPGFWFVSVNRSRSDGLSGFVGSLIRAKVRGEAEKGMEASLIVTRANMERTPLQARRSRTGISAWPVEGSLASP